MAFDKPVDLREADLLKRNPIQMSSRENCGGSCAQKDVIKLELTAAWKQNINIYNYRVPTHAIVTERLAQWTRSKNLRGVNAGKQRSFRRFECKGKL